MPPKKKQIYNDFFFFMQDQKAILRQEGRTWKDMPELVALCSPKWKLVSEAERAMYKNKAKAAKQKKTVESGEIFDSTGRSLVEIEKEKRFAMEKRNHMLQYIDSLVNHCVQNGTIGQQTFFFIHMNMICEIDNVRFLPGEVALCEFSIENGVTRIFESFVKPWDVPLGYGYTIRKIAETTHRIDLDSAPMNQPLASDYDRIFKAMSDFLCGNENFDNLPPIYTLTDQVPKVEGALLEWQNQTSIRKRIHWEIFNVDELYFSLSEALPLPDAKLHHSTLAKDRLEHDCYMFSQEMACPFHLEVDCNHHCSQFTVQKWAFIIAEHCCDYFNVPLKPGSHKPLDCAQGYEISKYSRPYLYPLLRNGEASYDPIQYDVPDGRASNVKKTRSTPSGVHYFPNDYKKLEVKPTFPGQTKEKVQMPILEDDYDTDLSSIVSDDFPALNITPKQTPIHGNEQLSRGWHEFSNSPSNGHNPPDCENKEDFPALGSGRRVMGGQRGRGFAGRGRRGRY